MKKLALLTASLLMSVGFFAQTPKSSAQNFSCDLALVLAMDASSSVNSDEYALQMKGMAAALLDAEVTEAILSLGGMYMAAFEWNGRTNQKMLFEWSRLTTEAEIFALAQALATHRRNSTTSPTALGSGLGFAPTRFTHLSPSCIRVGLP